LHKSAFQLCFYGRGGFTLSEVYNLPIYLRRFYLKTLDEEYKNEQKEIKKLRSSSKMMHRKK